MKSLSLVIKKRKYKTLSPLESKLVNLLLKNWINDFHTNYPVGPYFIDIAFPQYKIGLEIDGHKWHSSDEQIAKDELRQEYLEKVKGWRIERVAGWFCHKYPEISVVKALRHIDDWKNNPLVVDGKERAKQWYARDLLNRGRKDLAIKVLQG